MSKTKTKLSSISLRAAIGVACPAVGCLAAEHATVRNEHSTAAVTMASDSVASVGVMDGDSIVSKQPDYSKIEPPEWNGRAKKRFRELAIKEAFETISESEMVELRSLSVSRRQAEFPTPVGEIHARIQHDALVRKMEAVLNEYTSVHQ
jgi:hypothetical protein